MATIFQFGKVNLCDIARKSKTEDNTQEVDRKLNLLDACKIIKDEKLHNIYRGIIVRDQLCVEIEVRNFKNSMRITFLN